MINKTFLFTCFLLHFMAHSQLSQVDYNSAFLQDEVAEIHITIAADSLAEMLLEENLYLNHEYPATFVYRSEGISDTIPNIGFRLRGNTSRLAGKKSFKVSFNTFDNDQSYRGLEKMNLNGEHNDVSMLRSKICWEMLREADLPASRTSHIALYINEEFRGVYLNVEHIDEEYIEKRFGNNSGNLYKCGYGSNLTFLGDSPEAYKLSPWGSRIYELKTNTVADDYSDLAEFIGVLNDNNSDNFQCEIEAVLNVNHYLKTLVYEILFGHWDGYSINQNNYYLYKNPTDQRFYFLSFDLDNTLGVDFFDQPWETWNIYQWEYQERPLTQHLMAVPEYRARFTAYMEEALSTVYQEQELQSRLEEIQTLILPYALEDTYKSLDYGFENSDFENALSSAWGGHIPLSIGDFIEARANSALNQLESSNADFSLTLSHNNTLSNSNFGVLAETNGASQVELQYWWSSTPENNYSLAMLNDGSGFDLEAGDDWWFGELDLDENDDPLVYRARANYNGEWSDWTCEEMVWTSKSNIPLVINEIMPLNMDHLADEFGEYDDWCELYNAGNEAIFIGNKYLSNNHLEPNKWQLPNLTLEPGEFVLLWLDDDEEQGVFHADFALNNGGDELYLYGVEEGEYRLMDERAFGNIPPNFSIGASIDGGTEWILFPTPTPNSSNHLVDDISNNVLDNWHFYPNPASHRLHFSMATSGKLINIQGAELMHFQNTKTIDISGLSAGIYLLKVHHRTYRLVKS